MYFRLAWRNMWRSRRRTVITISSIFFAVIFAILIRVIIVGIFDSMIYDTVSMSCGYLQVHHTGFWDNHSVDSSFEENPKLLSVINTQKEITAWVPRLESFALASSGEQTKGIMLTGIDPERENSVSKLAKKVITGQYLADSDKSIMLAEGLAQYLKLKVNDTVILLGQGYQAQMAAGKYPVKAIVRLPVPEMNRSMAWLPMKCCQQLLSTGPRYTSISLMLDNKDKMEDVKQNILAQTKDFHYEVMTWEEMIPELYQTFQAKMTQNKIMSGILYLVIAFGIFGTILMMLNERMHEFGILIAIGMKRKILAMVVVLEMLLMSLVGTILGIVGAYPLVFYFYYHPIRMGGAWAETAERFNFSPVLRPSINPSHFIVQGYVVLLIAVLLSLYAIVRIHRIKAIDAINS